MENKERHIDVSVQESIAGCASIRFLTKIIVDSPVPTLVLDNQRRVISWNTACEKLTGVPATSVLGTQDAWRGFYPEKRKILAEMVLEKNVRLLPEDYAGIWFSTCIPDGVEAEGWFPALNGKSRYLVLSASPLRSDTGEILASVEIINDITERKIYEQQLASELTHDPDTGLPNRNLLVDRLQQAFFSARRSEDFLAVFWINLDTFSATYQNLAKDLAAQIINTIANRLQFEIRAIDTVAYLGNGEFVIVATRFQREEYIAGLAHRIHSAVSAPVLLGAITVTMTCTIGISAFPFDGADDKSLLENANAAMAQAKILQKGSLRFFSQQLNSKYETRLNLEAQLKNAIRDNEFSLHYQPKVSLETGRMTGMEALLRWTNKREGSVSPAIFIPHAERMGMIDQIGNWVFETACKQYLAWQKLGLSPPQISINLSGYQLNSEKFLRFVEHTLNRTEIDAQSLELEVTETAVVGNLATARIMLTKLKNLGFSISLDDFGTGYSSLSYLKQLPIDKIKIDRSFITEIVSDPSCAAITRATIAMGHALGLKVIAEGVENQEQFAYLKRLGCDEVQGFYYSRPVPEDELAALLRDRLSLVLETAEFDDPRQVLVVDDDTGILKSLRRELSLNGFQVETAKNAEEGFAALALRHFPVVISDFNMPGINGPEFLERVKLLHPRTVRVAISGSNDLDLLAKAINHGSIFKFIFKPWTEERILAVLEDSFRYYYSLPKAPGNDV